MNTDLFTKIEDVIAEFGWLSFGSKEFECSGVKEEEIYFYKRNDELPAPCNQCYKALIFWKDYYPEENVLNFLRMINSFETSYRGKFNSGVAVFYFRNMQKMLDFLDCLNPKMDQFGVKGRTQWRRACKAYQDISPHLWKNDTEFIPDA